jgi:hypothetical protein
VVTTRPSRPTSVKAALGLIAGQLVTGVVEELVRATGPGQPDAALSLLVVLAIELGLTGGLLTAIAYGKRWARIVYIVLVVLALPAMVLQALAPSQGSGGNLIWTIAALAFEVGAVSLLLGRPARDWFSACNACSSFAPAWYPDPSGRHAQRFWDGASWTPHVADGGHVAVDPLDQGSPSAVAW